MESFRTEIVATQQTRSDFLKWKLIICATLTGIGLGITGSESTNDKFDNLCLCLIPFVCVYVDLICYHLDLKMLVFNKFFSSIDTSKVSSNSNDMNVKLLEIKLFKSYENVCKKSRKAFELEAWALEGSSFFISSTLLALSFYLYHLNSKLDDFLLVIASVVGLVMTLIGKRIYIKKIEALDDLNIEQEFL